MLSSKMTIYLGCHMNYKITEHYARGEEKPIAEFNDLNEAIRLDAKCVVAYNDCAWLLTTCPDASVRNGQRAVTLATEACELTRWKQWQCVGTLAAAYAEMGDFTQAIKHQMKALALTGATEQERVEEQQRLQLYEEGKAYHEIAK